MVHLPQLSRVRFLHLAAAPVVLGGIWLAMLFYGGRSFDRTIATALYAGGHPLLIRIARIFTDFGEPTVLVTAGSSFVHGYGFAPAAGLRSAFFLSSSSVAA